MKKILILAVIFLVVFSFNIDAKSAEKLNTEADNLTDLSLSQDKSFSQSARKELLGIASQFDSAEDQNIGQLNFEADNFSLAETKIKNSQRLNLLNDLNFNADYSKMENDKSETTADFNLEYALNSRTLIRAGYSILNEEWWGLENRKSAALDNGTQSESEESKPDADNQDSDNLELENTEYRRVYNKEIDSSRSLGVAYKSSDRVTISADFIDNKEFGSYYNEDWDLAGDSTVFGVEYSYPKGSIIRARYQVDSAEDVIQRTTGFDFAFNNLATFSASYKLLDPKELEDTLVKQQTAWDLGLGVSLSEDYGMSLGYELIEGEDQEEAERKIKASFEINF